MTFGFRFGIEEEYFLVDRVTGLARGESPQAFWADLKRREPTASKELLQVQVEATTPPCRSGGECLEALIASRTVIDETAGAYGLGLLASGTHPNFDWRDSVKSVGGRYTKLERHMRMLAPRNLFCGLHVHVEIPKEISRISIMNRCAPYIPLFLAASVSSPFWRGQWTGMHGYRLTGYDELPRTGLPPVFIDEMDFENFVAALQAADAIPDATFLWWAIRPSARFPTLELRICDSVTNVRDAVAIGGFYRCLIYRLCRDQDFGARPTPSLRAIAEENRWQIQCDGLRATIIDVDSLRPIAAKDAIIKLIDALEADAHALGAEAELKEMRALISRGPSADRQIEIMRNCLDCGLSMERTIAAIIEWLQAETLSV